MNDQAINIITQILWMSIVVTVVSTIIKQSLFRKTSAPGIGPGFVERVITLLMQISLLVTLLTLIGYISMSVWRDTSSRRTGSTPGEIRNVPVSLHYRNAELKDVLFSCAKQAGVPLAMEKGITGKVTLDVNVPLEVAMNQICTIWSCSWGIYSGHPPVLFVRPKRDNSVSR